MVTYSAVEGQSKVNIQALICSTHQELYLSAMGKSKRILFNLLKKNMLLICYDCDFQLGNCPREISNLLDGHAVNFKYGMHSPYLTW